MCPSTSPPPWSSPSRRCLTTGSPCWSMLPSRRPPRRDALAPAASPCPGPSRRVRPPPNHAAPAQVAGSGRTGPRVALPRPTQSRAASTQVAGSRVPLTRAAPAHAAGSVRTGPRVALPWPKSPGPGSRPRRVAMLRTAPSRGARAHAAGTSCARPKPPTDRAARVDTAPTRCIAASMDVALPEDSTAPSRRRHFLALGPCSRRLRRSTAPTPDAGSRVPCGFSERADGVKPF
jgi:hypothetical protein